ncbi:hypothetical protein [Botrimarina colliarenosi]|uniref:hypothetical protein n=1 Tax=Botrimarina colliarenosi TaxID=2528001 RepID=UPI0018D44938|nr:hypothetical protein [Botrimarina colliarenosi]
MSLLILGNGEKIRPFAVRKTVMNTRISDRAANVRQAATAQVPVLPNADRIDRKWDAAMNVGGLE